MASLVNRTVQDKIMEERLICQNWFGEIGANGYDYLVGPLYADPRLVNWPFLNAQYAFGVVFLYFLVLYALTHIMEKRKRLELKLVTRIHSFTMFVLSCYMVYETVYWSYYNFNWEKTGVVITCQTLDRVGANEGEWTESGYGLARIIWIHYISKSFELLDTVIMVLKKNKRQFTFLHLWHHSTMIPTYFLNVKYGPGGSCYFPVFLNSLVHVFMYSYYLLASFGIKAPWKIMITQGQLLQFVAYVSTSSYTLYVDCYTPRLQLWQNLLHSIFFLILFINFYVRNYYASAPNSIKSSLPETSENDRNTYSKRKVD